MGAHDTHIWEINNPHMGHGRTDNPAYGMTKQDETSGRDQLARNLTSLMASSQRLRTPQAIEDATSKQIGHSSVARMRAASTNATVDHISLLASLFKVKPWQLLHPTGGIVEAHVSVEQALEALTRRLAAMPDEKRRDAAAAICDLAKAPDSQIQMRTTLEALGELRSQPPTSGPQVANL